MKPNNLRIIFAGTPEFATPSLQKLINDNYNVIAVFTQPDRPAGRGRQLTASPVKQLAQQHHIPVHQPEKFNHESIELLKQLQPDLMVVVAYGLLLPTDVLSTPTHGCINAHASLLPRWRGAAPIQRAISANDKETGVTIMQMDKGLDTGDMLAKISCPISPTDTSATLHNRLATLSANELITTINLIKKNQLCSIPQDHSQATYAEKITKSEANIDWAQSATQINCIIRAFNPWPVAFTQCGEKKIRIWKTIVLNQSSNATPSTIISIDDDGINIACGKGTLKLITIQISGGKPTPTTDLYRGHPNLFSVGNCLGNKNE